MKMIRLSLAISIFLLVMTSPLLSAVPVKGDGCSGGMSWLWRKVSDKPLSWARCCDEHDAIYKLGGTSDQRMVADRKLYDCVKENGRPVWANAMWIMVRAGGQPFMPFDWRWGFGRDYSNSWWYDR